MKTNFSICRPLIFFMFVLTNVSINALPYQNKKTVANFSLDENDTTRYRGHYLYEIAYQTIADMLEGKRNIDLKEANFAIENAYYMGMLNRTTYMQEINRIAKGLEAQAKSPMISAPTIDMALNYCIYLFYSQPQVLNDYNIYQYDVASVLADGGISGGMVATLLETGKGTCRSLPYLYLILAHEIGAEAYIATAPMHYYIRTKDNNGVWWNFETTTHSFSRTEFIRDNFYVSDAGIKSGLYMKNLNDKEYLSLLLYDLLYFYELKTGFFANAFTKKCYFHMEKHRRIMPCL